MKQLFIVLMSGLCSVTSLLGAIITERNDYCDWKYNDSWGNKTGCFPPPAYTFVGTSSRPGIDSCWIPYGTYTDGTGGTEYTRVTSNLMGVVASAIGGAEERWCAIGGTSYIDGPSGSETTDELADMYGAPILRPMDWDGTIHIELEEYLASTTNQSLRISDQLNRGIILCQDDVIYDSNIALEPLLACTRAVIDYNWGRYTNYFFNGGILGRFGSRRLEEMLGSVPPPISTSWSTNIPFDIAATNEWATVWPVFSACTNDIHFFPVKGEHRYLRVLPTSASAWGQDVFEARTNLYDVLSRTPLNVTVEDVLSADTGWKYNPEPRETNIYWTVSTPMGNFRLDPYDSGGDYSAWDNYYSGDRIDEYYVELMVYQETWSFYLYPPEPGSSPIFQYTTYAPSDADNLSFPDDISASRTRLYDDADDYRHWRNMTTRLDWKRLGIICQLERQMEITYEHDPYDGITLPCKEVFASHVKKYDDTVTINLPLPELGVEESYRIHDLNPSWTQYDESRSISSNDWGNSTPTCRLPAPTVGGNATIINTDLMQALHIDDGVIEDMMKKFATSASLSNGVHNIVMNGRWAPVNASSVRYQVDQATEWGWVEHPSNTVTAVIDGNTYSKTDTKSIADTWWRMSQDSSSLVQFWLRSEGSARLAYDGRDGSESFQIDNMAIEGGVTDGSATIPSLVLTASGDGDFTNWVWRVDGAEFENYALDTREDGVFWIWDDSSSSSELGIWFTYNLEESDYGNEVWWDSGNPAVSYYRNGIREYPRILSTPSGSVTWQSRTVDVWEPVKTWTSDIPDYSVGFKYDVTNANVRITLGIYKSARGIWTYLDNIDSSMEYYYLRWDDRIFYQEYPTVQGLLYDIGPHSCGSDYDPNWDNIKDYGGSGRLFRLSPRSSDRAQTKAQAQFVLTEIIRSLDESCKDKCVELGGPDPRVLSEFGKLTERDVKDVKDDIDSAEITAQYVIDAGNTNFVVSATVDVHDGEGGVPEITVSDCKAGYGEASAPPAFVCNYGWTFSTADAATTNINESVRADGSQKQIKRTLWKFKNLRDPNL